MKTYLSATKIETQSGQPQYSFEYAANEATRIIYRNYGYGLLLGEKAGGEKTKMRWSLFLTPNNAPAKGWNDILEMTTKQALDAVHAYANQTNVLEQQGRYVAIKYTTRLGFEFYVKDDGGLSYDLTDAKAFTYAEARTVFESATPHDYPAKYEGDAIAMVTMMDSINASYGEKSKHRHFRYEELEKAERLEHANH
jgi:hypothetical protein